MSDDAIHGTFSQSTITPIIVPNLIEEDAAENINSGEQGDIKTELINTNQIKHEIVLEAHDPTSINITNVGEYALPSIDYVGIKQEPCELNMAEQTQLSLDNLHETHAQQCKTV